MALQPWPRPVQETLARPSSPSPTQPDSRYVRPLNFFQREIPRERERETESKTESKRKSKSYSKRDSKRDSQRESKRESKSESKRDSKRDSKKDSKRERDRDREREKRERERVKTDFQHVNYLLSPFLRLSEKETKKSCALNRRGTHSLTYSCKAMLVASRRIPLASNYLLYNSTEELRAWLCNHGHAPFKKLWQAQARLLRLSLNQDTYAP